MEVTEQVIYINYELNKIPPPTANVLNGTSHLPADAPAIAIQVAQNYLFVFFAQMGTRPWFLYIFCVLSVVPSPSVPILLLSPLFLIRVVCIELEKRDREYSKPSHRMVVPTLLFVCLFVCVCERTDGPLLPSLPFFLSLPFPSFSRFQTPFFHPLLSFLVLPWPSVLKAQ